MVFISFEKNEIIWIFGFCAEKYAIEVLEKVLETNALDGRKSGLQSKYFIVVQYVIKGSEHATPQR